MIVPPAYRRPVRRALSIAVRYEHLAERGMEWVLEGTHHDPPKIRALLTGELTVGYMNVCFG